MASVFACKLQVPALIARGRPNFGFGFRFGAECGQMGTFGGHSVSAESSRTTFGALRFRRAAVGNSVVAESRVQSLIFGGRECARRRESLASLCTDWLCKDNRGSWLRCLHLHLVLYCGPWQDGIKLMTHCTAHKVGVRVKDIRCWATLSPLIGFGFRPKVKLPLSVDLYS